jgi:hypothetical protein
LTRFLHANRRALCSHVPWVRTAPLLRRTGAGDSAAHAKADKINDLNHLSGDHIALT